MNLLLQLNEENVILGYTIWPDDAEVEIDKSQLVEVDEATLKQIECGSTKYVDGQFDFSNDSQFKLQRQIRLEREVECFSIINRGTAWYNRLTEQQKSELDEWYQQWLDAPQTGIKPERLEWL